MTMHSLLAAALCLVPFSHGYKYEDILNVAPSNLTVSTRTGTFIGNLNDTYPDVRQFKYIPYAKVRTF